MKFTLATCVRNEGPYLLEWVAHYKLLGFDRIVIFSNDNDDGSDELLAAMQKEQLIEWRPRTLASGESPQASAFNAYSLELLADPAEHGGYLTWLDCDEYLVLKKHATISELLNYHALPDSLYINWKHFGSGGVNEFNTDLTISRFVACDSLTKHNRQCKCIARIDPTLYSKITNHRPVPLKPNYWGKVIYAAQDENGIAVAKPYVYGSNLKKSQDAPIFYEICQLNHYAVKSKEEYLWKTARGNGMKALDSATTHFLNSYFDDHDLNNESDSLASDKYAASIKSCIASMPTTLQELNSNVIDAAIRSYRTKYNTNGLQKHNLISPVTPPVEIKSKKFNPYWLSPELQRRAFRGYSNEMLIKRLAYATFVGDRSNYVFVETPKAACSSLKWVLADLEMRQVTPRQMGNESVASMVIHDRGSHNIKNIMQQSEAERTRLLTSNNVVRFCVVRNPYARIVSAWADKIRQKEPGFKRFWQIVAKHCNSDPQQFPSFPQFVNWVVETQKPDACNPHWRPMAYLLLPELFNYTHVLHTENLAVELQSVLDRIAPKRNAMALLKKHITNESLPVDWQTCYDAETAKRVFSFYKEDFESYGYLADSWKHVPHNKLDVDNPTFLREQYKKLELAALKSIGERNDVIFELAQKIKSDKKNQSVAPPKVLVLGDSHVKVFDHPEWKKKTPEVQWEVVSVIGSTLSGLTNPNSKTQAGKQFKQALSQHSAKVVILCLGEVDTGFVIWYGAEKNEITVEQAANRAVENYCSLIEEANQKAKALVISTPLPTLTDNNTEGAIAKARAEIHATQRQRTELTCWFNKEIEQWCNAKGISYINLDSLSKGTDGLVGHLLLHNNPKNHHYNPAQHRNLLFKNAFPTVLKLALA
ncbi:MAG: sulfotransferase family 2 domain-containing protein [Methylovulum sp.]|nr:sulfotransferase family 2 domain-containing protein [Methylovulum sp.]